MAGQQEGQSTPRRPWASTAGSGAPIWDELPLDQREEDGGSLTFALVALLGIPHVERNGHHYFFGLDHLTMEEREAALAHHQDLYRPFGRSAVLRIEDGALVLGSLQVPGMGFKPTPDMDAMQPPDAWLAAHGRDADLGS